MASNNGSIFVSLIILIVSMNVILPTFFPNSVYAQERPICNDRIKIAVVKPVFTATAYSSFYSFYLRHRDTASGALVTDDLGLLNATIVDGWGWSKGLYSFINSTAAEHHCLILGKNTWVINDIDVNDGRLFLHDGSRAYDAAILGFSEYVTGKEYSNYKNFVSTGGKLILLDAGNFVAEVKYNPSADKISLLRGHGWGFNGSAAWRDVFHRWKDENTNWVGSNYALSYLRGYNIRGAIANTSEPLSILMRKNFGQDVLPKYTSHEENVLTNASDKVIAYWKVSGPTPQKSIVAIYEHNYRNGSVISTGVFGSDIISYSKQMQYFVGAAVWYCCSRSPFG